MRTRRPGWLLLLAVVVIAALEANVVVDLPPAAAQHLGAASVRGFPERSHLEPVEAVPPSLLPSGPLQLSDACWLGPVMRAARLVFDHDAVWQCSLAKSYLGEQVLSWHFLAGHARLPRAPTAC